MKKSFEHKAGTYFFSILAILFAAGGTFIGKHVGQKEGFRKGSQLNKPKSISYVAANDDKYMDLMVYTDQVETFIFYSFEFCTELFLNRSDCYRRFLSKTNILDYLKRDNKLLYFLKKEGKNVGVRYKEQGKKKTFLFRRESKR